MREEQLGIRTSTHYELLTPVEANNMKSRATYKTR
jgi:hypothetical protein